MPNLADDTLDLFIKHDIDLMRVDADLRKKVDGIMAGLDSSVKNRVLRFNYANSSPIIQNKKLKQLVYLSTGDMEKAYGQLTKIVDADLSDLAVLEGATVTDTINKAIRVDLASNQVHLSKLKAMAGNTMLQGAPIKEWWSRQVPALQEAFKDQVRTGMLAGEGIDDMVRRIHGTRVNGYRDGLIQGRARNAAVRLVRSSVLAVANNARMETYHANSDVIKGVQWVSTLDNRTSDICKALDGQAWTLDGRKMKGTTQNWQGPPPAHWNCRSTTIPITKTFSELASDKKNKKKFAGLDKATRNKFRASANGKQAANINYEGWLKRQPISEQKKVLGETKYRLWKEDKISFTDLVDQRHNQLSVSELLTKFDKERALASLSKAVKEKPIAPVKRKKVNTTKTPKLVEVASLVENADVNVNYALNNMPITQRNLLSKFLKTHERKVLLTDEKIIGAKVTLDSNQKKIITDMLGRKPKKIDYEFGNGATAKGFTSKKSKHVNVSVNNNTSFSLSKTDIKKVGDKIDKIVDDLARYSGTDSRPYSFTTVAREGGQEALEITIHELGHQIHYAAGSPSVPFQFGLRDYGVRSRFKSLTDYGSVIDEEWHAEHFTAWMYNRKALAKFDPDIAKYFDGLIKTAIESVD